MKFADVDGQRMSAFPSGRGTCRACRGETHAKCGEFLQWHWAHKRGSPCGDTWWENESAWHRAWKNRFPEDWQEVPVFDADDTTCHIADVKTPAGLVIEFQRSTIHPEERRAREAFHEPMLWVVDGTRNTFDPINFRNFRGRIDPQSAIAGFEWYGRSRLFHRWHTQVPVFIDFGEHGFLAHPEVRSEHQTRHRGIGRHPELCRFGLQRNDGFPDRRRPGLVDSRGDVMRCAQKDR